MKRAAKTTDLNPEAIEAELRRRVEQLRYLPAYAAVAIKLIELGKDPDAGPADYDKTISSDPALGTKVLALANSAFFGVQHEIKKVIQAINLLGLSNIRALGISYCLAGLYNEVKTPADDAKRYWQASLCKGVAAKTYITAVDESHADEAFLAGLFQDVAIPLIHSVTADRLPEILRAEDLDIDTRLAAERDVFGVDHTEVGRWLADKLGLPKTYVDAIDAHHDAESLSRLVKVKALADATWVASMFPHLSEQWLTREAEKLQAFLTAKAPEVFRDREVFLRTVQQNFDILFAYFECGKTPTLRLDRLVPEACAEVADSTTRMVGQVQRLTSEAAETGQILQTLMATQEKLVDASRLDELTGVLNRPAFAMEATKILQAAARYATPLAVFFIDIDKFKQTNDRHGHPFGDFVLRELCARVGQHIRKTDVFGRIGGDEFVVVLADIQEDRARATANAVARSIREEPFVKGTIAQAQAISLGVLCIPGSRIEHDLLALIEEADALMYVAKRSGGGQMRFRRWSAESTAKPV
jgi:diguanylate cyclase (GGDEF)-like protein